VFFAPIKKLFEPVFTDHSQIAKIITSFVAIRKYQMSMPGSRTSSNEAMNNLIAQDDNNLIETFTAEYPFTNTLGKELEEMQKKYPTNKFLQVQKNKQHSRFNTKILRRLKVLDCHTNCKKNSKDNRKNCQKTKC
jgi:cephalosporin-C deacetylase-like acetyl esterase